MKYVINNAFLTNKNVDILIDGNLISDILPHHQDNYPAVSKHIDASGMAVFPAFYNTHTHASMSLMRGYAEEMGLFEWLNEKIWPLEARMQREDFQAGARLAYLEMIKSGTVFFNDMYMNADLYVPIVEQMGLRANLGFVLFDHVAHEQLEDEIQRTLEIPRSDRVQFSMNPHAIYTVNSDNYLYCAAQARKHHFRMHTHLAETQQEWNDCVAQFGMTPVKYLKQLGILNKNLTIAHAIYIDDEDRALLAESKTVISHCPCSNLKLSSGFFKMKAALDAGCRVTLGTDGNSSNNNLDMREEMKLAALLAKATSQPENMTAEIALKIATRNGAEAFGIHAGVIKKGYLADMLLVRLDDVAMCPSHNVVSNWVFSANTSLIDTVICDGKILMQNHHVEGEEEIMKEAAERTRILCRRK